MDKTLIDQQWNSLENIERNGLSYIRIDGVCIPDLNLAINKEGYRSLLLKVPKEYESSFLEERKENLRISFSKKEGFILLELLDNYYRVLFDDLIISLYHKIKRIKDQTESTKVFVVTIHMWASFMRQGSDYKLTKKTIMGLFGEMAVLRKYILESNIGNIQEKLEAWKGPYNSNTDFVFNSFNEEVKTKLVDSSEVKISSEFQLDDSNSKGLILTVVDVESNNECIETIGSLLTSIRMSIMELEADAGIVFAALSQKGIFLQNIEDYDIFKFQLIGITKYDCNKEEENITFPRIKKSLLPKEILSVCYSINLSELNKFKIEQTTF